MSESPDSDIAGNARVRSEGEALGKVLMLLMRVTRYQRAPIANVDLWVRPPVSLNQVKIFYDVAGNPVAYVIWARLATYVSSEFATQENRIIDITEWNEGTNFWITDVVCLSGTFGRVRRWITDTLLPQSSGLNWHRRSRRDRANRSFRRKGEIDG